ncbi:MAG TPA: glycosyltransferase family 2 protein [bacterium]|nr:glycosyltransferase family 2 protein [bacterium]
MSVVIPVYNSASTLGRAIRSVQSQTFQDFEVIVVDDGSSDSSEMICRTTGDARIRYFRHEMNRGAAAARNTGIRAAQGEYVAFLDSDDEWLPAKLESQRRVMNESPSRVGGVVTWTYIHLRDEGLILTNRVEIGPSLRKDLSLGCCFNPGSSLMVRREVYNQVGMYDESLRRHEDWDWLFRFADRFTLEVVRQPLVRVYRGNTPPIDQVEAATLEIIKRHLAPMADFGRVYRRKVIARQFMLLAGGRVQSGQILRGAVYLLRALILYPFHRPGSFLFLLDQFLGTALAVRLSILKARLYSAVSHIQTRGRSES